MNNITEESKSNVTPRLETDQVHKPAPDLIKSPAAGEIVSEEGIQIEPQTVNEKYKFSSSELAENGGSGVFDK